MPVCSMKSVNILHPYVTGLDQTFSPPSEPLLP